MPVELKKTVFNTGPDDKLRAIDVYAPGEVQRASESASNEQAGNMNNAMAEAAMMGLKALKNFMSKEESNAKTSDLLGLGLSDGQLAGLIEPYLPPSVDVPAMLQTLGDLDLDNVNSALDAVTSILPISDLQALPHGELVQLALEVVQPVRSGSVERVSDIPNDDVRILIRAGSVINKTQYRPIEDTLNVIENDKDFNEVQRNYVRERVAKVSASRGDLPSVAKSVESLTVPLSPMEKRYLVSETMQSYRKPAGTKKRDYPELAPIVVEQFNAIDKEWLYYSRGHEAIINLHVLGQASDDLLKIWTRHPELGTVASVLLEQGRPKTKTSKDLIKDRYPHMVIA